MNKDKEGNISIDINVSNTCCFYVTHFLALQRLLKKKYTLRLQLIGLRNKVWSTRLRKLPVRAPRAEPVNYTRPTYLNAGPAERFGFYFFSGSCFSSFFFCVLFTSLLYSLLSTLTRRSNSPPPPSKKKTTDSLYNSLTP